jgi:WD40 repeat protein
MPGPRRRGGLTDILLIRLLMKKSILSQYERPSTLLSIGLSAVCLAFGALGAEMKKEAAGAGKKVSYYKDIRPIFQANCQGCHQPAKAKGGYVMTDFKAMLAGGDSADKEKGIVPKKPDASLLVKLITPDKEGVAKMPQKGDPLDKQDIALIRKWISEGALDDTPSNAKARYDMEHPPSYSRSPFITSIDYSPDGKLLAVAGYHETLLHNADGSGLVARLVGLSARIESVAFSPDGKKLAVTGGLPARMGEVQVWDVAKRKLDLSVPITYDTVYGASWSPDGKHIAFGCSDSAIRAIDAKTGKIVFYQGAHDDWALDTVWSGKGEQIVSVGRDMSTKLYEFKTQRFVDNLTSITPGALKGGTHAIAVHPTRDEVLVGGSDGAPQIYRLTRIAKRVIGDNSNLVRKFSSMPGRIFDVAYSPDGKRIAAGSSLDGRGFLHIYNSDFDPKVSDDLKKAFAERVASQKPAQKKMIAEYQSQGVKLQSVISVIGGVYATAFSPDGRTVAAAGGDGAIRFYGASDGSLKNAYIPVPLPAERMQDVIGISVEPSSIKLGRKFDYTQTLVTGWLASGDKVDLTREAKIDVSAGVAKATHGQVRPLKDGKGEVKISHKGHSATIPIEVANFAKKVEPDYVRDVMPAISRMGCNAGTCHGAKDGKNGFKLSLRGYDPIYDVRAFVDDHEGRRINFAAADDSLMLLKATGAVPHEGGQRTKPESDYYQIVRDWIANGCKLDTTTAKVASIEIFPKNPVVQEIGTTQQVRVVATYADKTKRDVTAEAFIESGNMDIAVSNEGAVIGALRRGEAPLLARFEGAYAATTLTVMGDRTGFKWADPPANNVLDKLVAAKWKRMRIQPSGLCTDAEFVRRVRLDLTGLPPSADDVRKFLADKRESRVKRDELIDKLIGSPDYIDHWANKWADLLQVNRKFLGAEGSKAFREWIRNEVASNTPYDDFVRKIVSANGSNKENPAASYYKILRTPDATMENTTHLFLATRFNCNKCHDHPFERWTQDQYYEMAAYFARVGLKRDPKAGKGNIGGTAVEGAKPLYEIVYEKPDGEMKHERTGAVTAPHFPFNAKYKVSKTANRREHLAAWITSPDNEYFARSYVNRLWGYMTGTGIIEPLDDIRAGNPPSNPELLDHLAAEFIKNGFDVRKLVAQICKTRVYQLSIKTNKWNEDDEVNFSHGKARRLPAEVLFDAIYMTTGSKPNFPGVAAGTRAAQLPDVGVKLPDGFLGNLGRPARESACECERSNELQLGPIMALVSGPTVDMAISDKENAISKLVTAEKDDKKIVNELFMRILNREATKSELENTVKIFKQVKPAHDTLLKELAAYEKQLKPILIKNEKEREKLIGEAKKTLAGYEKEIAPREADLEKKQNEAIAKADASLKEHQAKLGELAAAWEKKNERATSWAALDPKTFTDTGKATLTKLKDLSILASGKNVKGKYVIVAETDLAGITGFKLEALSDKSLPKNGPGRAKDDGNFVLTEFEVKQAPKSDPKKAVKVALQKATATFNQASYNVTTAIDGKRPAGGNGWAVSGGTGKDQAATFEAKKAFGSKGGTILTFTFDHNFSRNGWQLGRFRLNVTNSKQPIDFGLPEDVSKILEIAADKRDEKQAKRVVDFYATVDKENIKRKKALADTKQPRPIDPKLTDLKVKLGRAEQPLPEDPQLKALKRAKGLSGKQLENTRLTAAQDVAWALINNPAFLFNR